MNMNMAGAQMQMQNAQAFGDMMGNVPWDEMNFGNNTTNSTVANQGYNQSQLPGMVSP